MRSTGTRFLIVGFLALAMFLPLLLIADVIDDRADFSRTTIFDVGREWGGPQIISGPMLVVPVTASEPQKALEIDPVTGRQVNAEGPVTMARPSVYLYPDSFDARFELATEIRRRGFFDVPVYTASLNLTFDFPTFDRLPGLETGETAQWDAAEVVVGVTTNRALRGTAELRDQDRAYRLVSRGGQIGGFAAQVGDLRGTDRQFTLRLGLNGAERLAIAPVGQQSVVTMVGDWPHPSFTGAFLPDDHQIDEAGFEASWTIPHLASNLPRQARTSSEAFARDQSAFGVAFAQPNDFYQKSFRAARYGILFIALTFLTVLLMDRHGRMPAHPVQYLLIGIAQSVFFLLLVAFAEQVGFGVAYLIASAATVGLLAFYGVVGLGLARRAAVLTVLLIVLYAVLYVILQSVDYALLAGSLLAFAALAVTMYATRNEDWYATVAAAGKQLERAKTADGRNQPEP